KQEPEEQAKGGRGDPEEVDGDNLADMCPEEGAPRRGRPRRGMSHVLCNGELRDLIAEEAEFGLDPAPAPGWVLSGHAADERAELKIERRATRGAAPGLPAPVELKTLAVPGEDGRGLDNNEAGLPARPQLREPYADEPVPPTEPGTPDG